jgi:hypothetical protein
MALGDRDWLATYDNGHGNVSSEEIACLATLEESLAGVWPQQEAHQQGAGQQAACNHKVEIGICPPGRRHAKGYDRKALDAVIARYFPLSPATPLPKRHTATMAVNGLKMLRNNFMTPSPETPQTPQCGDSVLPASPGFSRQV